MRMLARYGERDTQLMVDAYAYGWIHEWLEAFIVSLGGGLVGCIISRVIEAESENELGMHWNERILSLLAIGLIRGLSK
jgi:hypothetical protein